MHDHELCLIKRTFDQFGKPTNEEEFWIFQTDISVAPYENLKKTFETLNQKIKDINKLLYDKDII